MLADSLFGELIAAKKSFIWDSSMSNVEEATKRVKEAKEAGYELTLVAVLTPVAVAIRQAMERARETKRFPNAKALIESNATFKKAFFGYLPDFDEVVGICSIGGFKRSSSADCREVGPER
jgi:hypothetical protein